MESCLQSCKLSEFCGKTHLEASGVLHGGLVPKVGQPGLDELIINWWVAVILFVKKPCILSISVITLL